MTTPPAARPCAECGYDLRGLPDASPCPECGHVTSAPATEAHAGQGPWEKTVALGLAAWVALVPLAVGGGLILPFRDRLGGSLAVVNFPGPKVWATPALFRQIGYGPQFWGVLGVVVTLLNLAAVWMLTAPRSARQWDEGTFSRRNLARWAGPVLVGGLLGLTLGGSSVGLDRLQTLTTLAVGLVEAPATLLVYLHLSRLAGDLQQPRLAAGFGRLAYIAGGAALLGGLVMWLADFDADLFPGRGEWPLTLLAAVLGATGLPAALYAATLALRLRRAVLGETATLYP